MSKPSLDQRRAAHALKRVEELEKEDAKIAGRYVGYVKALPATILSNGLGQALATELAARDEAHDRLAEHVARWLLEAPGSPYGKDLPKADHAKVLLNRIVVGDQRAYVWGQAEAIAYVGWLKKLAVAFLSKDSPSKQEAQGDAG
jgi:CRISPR-associated protein Cmr5